MTRRRRSSARHSLEARKGEPSRPTATQKHRNRRKFCVAFAAALSALLLTLSFAPFDVWPLAYVALVPWAVALLNPSNPRWALLWAVLGGALFWAGNLYWLWWITLTGYAALVVYLTAYWLLAALLLRGGVKRGLPAWLVLPVVWVAMEYARAYVISGFPWFFLAHSQYARTRLIQIADLTGQYGVSFFVALVNGVLIDIVRLRLYGRHHLNKRAIYRAAVGAAVAAVLLGGMLGYGSWRLKQQTLSEGPVIGIVQQAFRNTLAGRTAPPETVFTRHVEATQSLMNQGCELVIWPETMLPSGLNGEFLTANLESMSDAELRSLTSNFVFLEPDEHYGRAAYIHTLRRIREGGAVTADGESARGCREYAEQVAQLSDELGCPLLAGGVTLHPNPRPAGEDDLWVPRNSALWFDGDPISKGAYSKMHLVPLSEYVPFKHSWPWLHRQLRRFVPPVMHQLDPGPEIERFSLRTSGGTFRIAAPICYEGTFARIARDMVVEDRIKMVDILANLSNDGWFVYSWRSGPPQASTEHAQHMVQYVFRAVETRTAVVRAVNTGISASIDPNGRIAAILEKYGSGTMVPGTLVLDGESDDSPADPQHGPKVLVDSRVSMYSLVGDVFAQVVSAAAGAYALWLIWKRLSTWKGSSQ
ncbi:MAG: apolipoprotein N-acyltransferase [Phycisphaerae bacterium]